MAKGMTVSHRGAKYEIGLGRDCYAIWPAGATNPQPVAWWPETPEGWSAAWSRFTSMEAPGSIVAASRAANLAGLTAAAPLLLAAGVVFGIVGLFPTYLNGSSLAQQPELLVPHVIYLAAWTLGALLIATGGGRRRAGTLLAAGVSAVTFGLFFADAGTVLANGSHVGGVGLVLALIGWLGCAAGTAVAVTTEFSGSAGWPASVLGALRKPRPHELGPILLLIAAAIGVAIAFAPSWDSYTLQSPSGSQTVTAGNAFSNPGAVIAGDVIVMVALVAAVALAALWRPVRLGSALLLGAIIPMAAQAISALVQAGQGASPAIFGISPAQAAQNGITASAGLTTVFWVYCMLVLVLLVSCAWLTITPMPARPAASPAAAPSPAAAASPAVDAAPQHSSPSGWTTPEPWMPSPDSESP